MEAPERHQAEQGENRIRVLQEPGGGLRGRQQKGDRWQPGPGPPQPDDRDPEQRHEGEGKGRKGRCRADQGWRSEDGNEPESGDDLGVRPNRDHCGGDGAQQGSRQAHLHGDESIQPCRPDETDRDDGKADRGQRETYDAVAPVEQEAARGDGQGTGHQADRHPTFRPDPATAEREADQEDRAQHEGGTPRPRKGASGEAFLQVCDRPPDVGHRWPAGRRGPAALGPRKRGQGFQLAALVGGQPPVGRRAIGSGDRSDRRPGRGSRLGAGSGTAAGSRRPRRPGARLAGGRLSPTLEGAGPGLSIARRARPRDPAPGLPGPRSAPAARHPDPIRR